MSAQATRFRHVCLIDDDPINNLICRELLISSGFAAQIEVFERAQEALDWLASQPPEAWPELIFLDINMPGMSGWEFLQALGEPARPCSVRILSSSQSAEDQAMAKRFPLVEDYIAKPLRRDYLQRS